MKELFQTKSEAVQELEAGTLTNLKLCQYLEEAHSRGMVDTCKHLADNNSQPLPGTGQAFGAADYEADMKAGYVHCDFNNANL